MERKQIVIGVSLFLSIVFMIVASVYGSIIGFSIFSVSTVILYYFFKDKELIELDLKVIGFFINLCLWGLFLGACIKVYLITVICIGLLIVLISVKAIIEKIRDKKKKDFL